MALYLGDTKISSAFTVREVTPITDVLEYVLLKDSKTNKIYMVYFENGELHYKEQE